MGTQHAAGRRARGLTLALPLAGGLLAAACGEQDSASEAGGSCYEGEQVSFVVAYGEGGLYDVFARTAAPYLEDQLGATVVVENHAGAGGPTPTHEI